MSQLLGSKTYVTSDGSVPVTANLSVGAAVNDTDAIQRQQKLNLMTAQATTSGTAIDFTGIPSWVKRITVMFNGVSTSGTSQIQLRIGSGSIDATSYAACSWNNGGTASQVTTGFPIQNGAASDIISGSLIINTLGGYVWVCNGSYSISTTGAYVGVSGGNKTIAGTLDRLRLTTVNGTDTFDAGSVNVMYE